MPKKKTKPQTHKHKQISREFLCPRAPSQLFAFWPQRCGALWPHSSWHLSPLLWKPLPPQHRWCVAEDLPGRCDRGAPRASPKGGYWAGKPDFFISRAHVNTPRRITATDPAVFRPPSRGCEGSPLGSAPLCHFPAQRVGPSRRPVWFSLPQSAGLSRRDPVPGPGWMLTQPLPQGARKKARAGTTLCPALSSESEPAVCPSKR